MRTNKQLKLHQRCLDICDMIVTCNNRLHVAEKNLDSFRNTKPGYSIYREQDFIDKIEKYEAIKKRLVQWYGDVMQRLCEPIFIHMAKNEAAA